MTNLFEKYKLDINENDPVKIEQAMSVTRQKIDKLLNAMSPEKREKGEELLSQWEKDREILMNESSRKRHREEIMASFQEIIDYLVEHQTNPDVIKDAAELFGKTEEEIASLYKEATTSGVSEEIKTSIFEAFHAQQEYTKIYNRLSDVQRSDLGLDRSLFVSCDDPDEMRIRIQEYYNKKKMEAAERDAFVKLLSGMNIPDMPGVLLHYISQTAKIIGMRSITADRLAVPEDDLESYIDALAKTLSIKVVGTSTGAAPKQPKKGAHLEKGMQALSGGDYREAMEQFDKELTYYPNEGDAYLGRYFAKNQIQSLDRMYAPGYDPMQDKDYKTARYFGADNADFKTFERNLEAITNNRKLYENYQEELEAAYAKKDMEALGKLEASGIEKLKNALDKHAKYESVCQKPVMVLKLIIAVIAFAMGIWQLMVRLNYIPVIPLKPSSMYVAMIIGICIGAFVGGMLLGKFLAIGFGVGGAFLGFYLSDYIEPRIILLMALGAIMLVLFIRQMTLYKNRNSIENDIAQLVKEINEACRDDEYRMYQQCGFEICKENYPFVFNGINGL